MIALMLAAVALVGGPDSAQPVASLPPAEGWKLVADLSDEFDGTALDAGKWWDHNPAFFGRDWAHFAFSPDNVKVEDGMLRLVAREMRPDEKTFANVARGYDRWSTATVKSRRQALYGYFECRARVMRASVCNAFWLYDPLSGDPARKHKAGSHSEEIDIFEMCGKPRQMPKGSVAPSNVVMMTFHRCETPYVEATAAGAWQQLPNKAFQYAAPFDIAGGFHRYGLLWTEAECVFYVDGIEVARRKNDYFHQPLHVMLDCECIIFGEPDPTDLPASFDIDWVRVWQREK